jgi:LacI family transcriptional regulator
MVVLATSRLESTVPRSLGARGIPFVLLNREVDGLVSDAAVVDNVGGAALLADLLVELGHQRIGAVLGSDWTRIGRDREQGFRRGLAAHGCALSERLITRVPFGFDEGGKAVQVLICQEEPPTALFCANDVLALGALDGATSLGVRVPDDLTVVGFDDITLAAWACFALTTVRCDLPRLAAVAAELLLRRIADRREYHHRVVLPAELVLRGTHASPPPSPKRATSRAPRHDVRGGSTGTALRVGAVDGGRPVSQLS